MICWDPISKSHRPNTCSCTTDIAGIILRGIGVLVVWRWVGEGGVGVQVVGWGGVAREFTSPAGLYDVGSTVKPVWNDHLYNKIYYLQ